MAFFFFGTLMDLDVLAFVLDREVDPSETRPATLAGFRRVCSQAATYPVLVADDRGRIEGSLLLDPSERDALRITHFEDEEYEAAWMPVRLPDGEELRARVFLALETMPPLERDWELRDWAEAHKAAFLERCREWMKDAPR